MPKQSRSAAPIGEGPGWLVWILKWLKAPFSLGEEEKSIRARTINRIQLYFLAALMIVAVVMVPLLSHRIVESYAIILVIFILNLISRYLLFRGHLETACTFIISSLWVLFWGVALISGGIASPLIFAIQATAIVGGWILKPRAGTMVVILSILAGLGLAVLQQTGRVLPQFFILSPIAAWFLFALGMVFVYGLMNLVLNDLSDALAREHRQNEARQQAEQALRQSEERFQMFMRHFPGLAYMKDSAGRILFVNQGFNTYLGFVPQEMIGKTSPEFFGPEFGEKLNRDDQRILELGASEEIEEEFAGRTWMTHKFCIDQPGASPLLGGVTIDTTDRLRAVEALRESEERYKLMFEQAPIAINITRGTQITYANPAYLGMFGYSNLDELQRLAPLDLFTPESRPQILENIQRREQGLPVPNAYHSECFHKDGSRFPILMYLTRAVFPDGPATLAFIQDITGRKKSEEALRESQSTLNAIIDSTSDMIWSVDPESFGLLTFNQGLCSYFLQHRNIRVTAGMRPEDLFPNQAYSDRWRGFYQRALKEGPYTIETVSFAGALTFLLSFNILQREGKIFGISVFGKDVTERNQSQEQLQILKYSIDAAPEGAYWMNLAGRFIYVNDAACKTLGYTREELLQMGVQDVNPRVTPAIFAQIVQTLREKKTATVQSVHRRKDGSRFPVELNSTYIQYGDKEYINGFAQDITERNQRENELQAIATLSAALRTAPTRSEMLPVIVEQIGSLIQSDAATIEIIDPQSGEAVVEAAYGIWKPLIWSRQKKGTGINAIISQTLKPYRTTDLRNDPNLAYPTWAHEGICASAGMPLITQEKLIGFIWIGRKAEITDPEIRLLSAIADITANAIHRSTSHEQTLKAAADLSMAYDTTLEGWARALELRDQETEGHARRVVDMTVELAKAVGIQGGELENVRRGALLHDIGKMGIPDSVLLKPGTLNEREWEIMRRHTEYARDLLMPIDYLRKTVDIPYDHHEKWDGTGYPRGLKGEEIPLAARLFAVADVWDALTSDRPYRKAWSREQALRFIREQKGKHFDPRVVDLFLDRIEGA